MKYIQLKETEDKPQKANGNAVSDKGKEPNTNSFKQCYVSTSLMHYTENNANIVRTMQIKWEQCK